MVQTAIRLESCWQTVDLINALQFSNFFNTIKGVKRHLKRKKQIKEKKGNTKLLVISEDVNLKEVNSIF